MDKKTKRIIVIAGPTAVGKTDLSLEVAEHFNTVILSADSRQFYKELEIGTAKPSPEELTRVKHYFINSLSIHDTYDVAQYERDALSLLNELFQTYHTVVVTGGSGLYIKALCEGMDDMPAVAEEIREKWNLLREEKGLAFLQDQVKTIDPEYFEIVDQHNPIRLTRAMEVYEASGKNMTYWRSKNKPSDRPFDIVKIALERPREELYERIDLRMDLMIEEGLFNEAKEFYAFKDLNALQTVGYTEIFEYLDGKYDKEEAIRLLKRNSRRYAKRQLTWFKKDKEFKWFHPENEEELIDYLSSK
ncbi:tRNA (adenosine(37)-N6)-dimethylallyltransferase MiaA [Marivirga atlantica]|uniref:tRNA dimethylallyltransferase n=1 Tax=Marivirga atlantica TaxID=1548457 RepID=A0A937DKJ5_9BACT|nr:tRNA (adenosine(37)-N6)-dimethylallyltransferase MiaA [Marivirga atlantica]MBL0766099.1 tRNA (adenosine(37)-N6)-dimethylallyltransferase MiaA [Marivirga atlantica]